MQADPRSILKAQTPSQAQIQDQRRRANQQPAIDEALTEAEVARAIEPVGSSKSYWGLADPPGGFYMITDGRELDPITYPDLYAVLGTRFNTGAETPGFFRLPKTAGRVIAAPSTGEAGLTDRAVGDKFGSQNHTLITTEMPAHGHDMDQSAGHTHRMEFSGNSNTNTSTNGTGDRLSGVAEGGGGVFKSGSTNNDGAHQHTLTNAGGGLSHPNLQPTIAAYDIIRVLP